MKTRTRVLVICALFSPAIWLRLSAAESFDAAGIYRCTGTMDGKTYSIALEVEQKDDTYELLWSTNGQPTHVGVAVMDRNEMAVTFVTVQQSAGTALYHVTATALTGVWAFVREPRQEPETCTRIGKVS